MRADNFLTPTFNRALSIRERFKSSYWDAAILAAAGIPRCSIVYSEDLNHGQDYEGIRVENPFFALIS
jgi:predicted nucleic acid-binding protein